VKPALPPRLLTETEPAPSTPSIAAASLAADLPTRTDLAGTDEQPTEVHVHIGRIEVSAVHEAPPQKKSRPAARRSASLTDYLARRKS
jgi:hypothetical protein